MRRVNQGFGIKQFPCLDFSPHEDICHRKRSLLEAVRVGSAELESEPAEML